MHIGQTLDGRKTAPHKNNNCGFDEQRKKKKPNPSSSDSNKKTPVPSGPANKKVRSTCVMLGYVCMHGGHDPSI